MSIPGAGFFDSLPDFSDFASNPTIILIIAAVIAALGAECAGAVIPVPIIPNCDTDPNPSACPEQTAAGQAAEDFFSFDQSLLEFSREEQATLDAPNIDLNIGFELEPNDPDAPEAGLSLWMDQFQQQLEDLNERHQLAYGQRRYQRHLREQRGQLDGRQRREPDRLTNRAAKDAQRRKRFDPFALRSSAGTGSPRIAGRDRDRSSVRAQGFARS